MSHFTISASRILFFAVIIACLQFTCRTAYAADISLKTVDNGVVFVIISGDLEYGDDKKFVSLALPLENAGVVFQSNGGNLNAGIEIGRAIRLKGFVTIVFDGQVCASACAFAWLGGRIRMMGGSAHVGFHAAFIDKFGQKTETGSGNAIVGAYLSQLGLGERAIVYATMAAPDEMRWLTFEDAQSIGIDVKPLGDGQRQDPPSGQTVDTEISHPDPMRSSAWDPRGDWIQIFTRSVLNDAVQLAQEYQKSFPNTFVFKHVNGPFVVVIGPFPDGSGQAQRLRSLAANAIPKDSIVAKGYRLVELEFGNSLPSRSDLASSNPDMEGRAIRFFSDFNREWSTDNPSALNSLRSFYADPIKYYGTVRTKAEVMDEKAKFAFRWAKRTYLVRSGTASASCASDSRKCTVSGLVDWRATTADNRTTSVGTVQYELTLRLDVGSTLVIGEKGVILSRSKTTN